MHPTHRHAQSFPDLAGLGAPHPADGAAPGLAVGSGERTRLVVHLIDALDSAHLEMGLLNLIRHLPGERYRHAIVCLRDHGDHGAGLREQGVDIVKLHQRAQGGLRAL
ncbi:MAG: hypothetical protein WCC39_16080, partial [Telluria sp.]